MALQGTAQAIGAGESAVTIAGTFAASYQIGITPGWVTGWGITAKTAASFTVTFAVPAPAGGSTFDWTAGTAVTPDSSATATVTAAAVSVAVAGTFAGNYQVALGPAWVTAVDRITKTPVGFTVQFSIPAPAGGSTLDWIVSVPVNTTAAVQPTTPIASATVPILAAATTSTIAVSGALPGVYEVVIAPGWVTDYDVIGKSAAGFTVNFATPAPAGDSEFDYIIFGPQLGVVTLSDYLDELRDLLHDPNDRFWSAAQKTRYINRALLRRDIDTGVNRSTFTFTLTTGTGSYTLAQVNGRIFDVISITLIFGTTRCVLNQVSLTELNIRYRPQTTFTGWTSGFARQNQTIIFGPTPSQAFVTEWDCASYALPLINLTDTDPLPYPYTQPVPYFAAYQAKINEREGGERDDFLNAYMELIGLATNGKVGRLPNAYGGLGGSWR